MKKNTGVIVLGGHVQALGIVREYGRLDIPAIVIDNTNLNIARHSKYCESFYKVNDDSIFLLLNESEFLKKYQGWLIFPTNDYHVKILSINKPLLNKFYKVTTDNWDSVSVFFNKRNTYSLAEKLKIPIAKTHFPNSEEDLGQYKLEYPCIIKPAVMFEFFRKLKKKVFICHNFEELISNYKEAIAIIPSNEVIIQEIITGNGENQISACFLFLKGESYASMVACRLRQHPLGFGNATTYAEIVDLPDIIETSKKLLKEANYNGLCEVEFKKDDRDGVYKLLEVNPRTWKWHMIASKAEIPFLENFYHYLMGEKISRINEPKFASYRHFITDIPIQIQLLFQGKFKILRVRKPLVNAVYSFYDLKPWIFEKIYLFNLIRKRS